MPLRSLKVCQGEDDKSYSSQVFLNLNPKLFRAGIVVECIFFMKGHTVRMDGVVREGFFFFLDHCLHFFVDLLRFSMISFITLVAFVLPSSFA